MYLCLFQHPSFLLLQNFLLHLLQFLLNFRLLRCLPLLGFLLASLLLQEALLCPLPLQGVPLSLLRLVPLLLACLRPLEILWASLLLQQSKGGLFLLLSLLLQAHCESHYLMSTFLT